MSKVLQNLEYINNTLIRLLEKVNRLDDSYNEFVTKEKEEINVNN